ncbi:MAG: outer membrane beta-barrel protein [Oceanospirillaceae bacterium]|nr:outer membrane beta-barrel protein [Oceanospirillaceae bacterium]
MLNTAKRCKTLPLLVGLIFSQHSLAIEPAAIPIGEMNLFPSLNVITGYDDNILSTETNKISSWITRISPSFLLEAEDHNTLLRVGYSLEKGILHSSSPDNYLDHNFTTSINYIANSRNRFDLQASYIVGHEARGDEDGGAISSTSSPLEYDLKTIQGIYTYGRKEATGIIELRARYQDKEFTNFRLVTLSRDYEQVDLGAEFKYRLTAKTSAIANITRNDIDYDTSNRDSTNMRYLLGATWEATAKTSGTIKVGWSEKDFKDASLDDGSGGTWDAEIYWNPKSYSTFIFSSGQEYGESTTAASYIDTNTYGINWQHFWKDNIKSTVAVNILEENYSNSIRKDTTDTFLLGLNYEMKRWLNLGLGYTYTDKDSNINALSFKKNSIMFTVQASL